MPKKVLKCQFHTHSAGDPCDNISHSPRELIDEAARLKYQVLAITCHRKLIFDKDLKKYAKNRGITLIPGIEFEINKKHILGINIDRKIEDVKTYEELRLYRESHPDCLIIAAHPFFPGPSLKKDLINNIQLFDAIEISWAYTKTKDYNAEAIALAKRWKKPLIATADCHFLKDLNLGFCEIDAKANPDNIVQAVKDGKIQNQHSPTSYYRIGKFFAKITGQKIFKRRRK